MEVVNNKKIEIVCQQG